MIMVAKYFYWLVDGVLLRRRNNFAVVSLEYVDNQFGVICCIFGVVFVVLFMYVYH